MIAFCNNLDLSLKDYSIDHQSKHWEKFNSYFLKQKKGEKDLLNFRRQKYKIVGFPPGKDFKMDTFYAEKLSEGLDGKGGLYKVLEHLLNLIDKCGKNFIDKYSECQIGNPDEVYTFSGKKYNYNDLSNINHLFDIIKNINLYTFL